MINYSKSERYLDRCISLSLSKKSFDTKTNKKSLFVSFFFRVGTVDLARNQLTKVEFQMFADLRFIDTIDLAENQISEVQREAFKNIYLTKINMSHNFIEEMADNAFR